MLRIPDSDNLARVLQASNPEIANSIGRVAAASFAFQGGQRNTPPPPAPRGMPPPPTPRNAPPVLPRRTSSQAEQEQVQQEEEEEDPQSLAPPDRPPASMRKTSGASGLSTARVSNQTYYKLVH